MLKKFLDEVVTITVGKQAEPIAELLNSRKHVNEFTIAKKLDITINQTRNILYKLSDSGLVSSIRKKDKKKGWYTYFWKIENAKALEFLKAILEKRIVQFENQISNRETKQFYVCELCNIEFNEENALLNNFTCNECGGVFSMKNNTNLLRGLKRNLDRLKEELSLIDTELAKEEAIFEKKKQRVLRKEAKEKLEKKALAALRRKATREAKLKAEGKWPPKIKATKKKAKKTLKKDKKAKSEKKTKNKAKKTAKKSTSEKSEKKTKNKAKKTAKKSTSEKSEKKTKKKIGKVTSSKKKATKKKVTKKKLSVAKSIR